MLKQENNHKKLIEQLNEKKKKIEIEYEKNIENCSEEKKRELTTIFRYEQFEVKEEMEIVKNYIKKMEYKEKVEIEYENLVRDSKE
jgi:hypothetical protein